MKIGVPSSKITEDFLVATDEGEAVAIGAGYYLATGDIAKVYMDGNGFSNALDAITSLLIPYKIPVDIIIAKRDEPWHCVMGNNIERIADIIGYNRIHIV
jgi:phosphonopyruvate decarboxylase